MVDFVGRRLNGILGLSLNDRTNLFLVILLDKTVAVRYDSLCIRTLALSVPDKKLPRSGVGVRQ